MMGGAASLQGAGVTCTLVQRNKGNEEAIKEAVKEVADRVLHDVGERKNGVPGMVPMATDRRDNFYEGVAGKRELGKDQEMTTDTVVAIFSCTKAVTGVTVMQLIEEGRLSFDDPSKKFVPEIAQIQVFESSTTPGSRAFARRTST
jgi:methyl acetate hydrolase